jgi:integrase
MKYLTQHRTKYYFKRKIPTTKKHIVISLRTDSLTEANFIIAIITPKFDKLLNEKVDIMDYEEEIAYIKKIIQEYVDEAKEDYTKYSKLREERYTYTTKKDKVRLGSHPKAIDKAIKYLSESVFSPNRDKVYENLIKATELENKCDYAISIISEDNQDRLKDEIIKAEIELLENDRDNNFNRTNKSNTYIKRTETPLIQTISPFPMPNYTQTEIKQNLSYYKKKREEILIDFMEKKTEETKEPERYERDVQIFFDLINKDYLIDLSHEDMKNFLKDIFFLPNRNDNREIFKNAKSFREVIDIAKDKKIKPIAKKTIRNKLININAFLDYAIEYDYLDKNKLRYKISISTEDLEDAKSRKEFYPEQLFSLFYKSKWYSEDLEQNLKTNPSKIWLPLILLFTGCRLNEIAQIYIEQITEKEDIHFFRIEDKHEDQKLKNRSSRRKIPIHPILIKLGILKFIKKQKEENKVRLFPELYSTENKGYGQAFSKIFNNKNFKFSWLDKQAKEKLENEDILLDLHSFRHNFSGSLKGLVEDGLLDYFMGHSQTSQTQKRYGEYRTELVFNEISKSVYKLDFKPLEKSINNFYDNLG